KTKIPYQEILQVYNETVGDRLPNAESLNDKRKRAIGKFWKELKNPSVDAARNYFEVFVETANPWYFGENDRGWRASFDYLLRPDTVTKTREGAL
ncbi:MAG TPA: helix-turn-helix domain-containing protein, partial [Arsenophonus nasoniae]